MLATPLEIALDRCITARQRRGQRTYSVSDERMQAFAQLTPLQRLQWVEQCSHFVRLGQKARQAERAHQKFQFERHAYFVADRADYGVGGKVVLNRVTELKDSCGM